MGDGRYHENGIPNFVYYIIVNTWCFEHRGQCFLKEGGGFNTLFSPKTLIMHKLHMLML
jgi:hypothetical protein